MTGVPFEYPPTDGPSPEETGASLPILDLRLIAEEATTCPAVMNSEWTFINAVPSEAPTRLAVILLLHATPEIDLEELDGYLHLHNLVDDLSHAQRRSEHEKDLQAVAEEKLGKIAAYGKLSAFMALARHEIGKVANRYRSEYEGDNHDLDELAQRRARLGRLFDATDRPNNPILLELLAIRRGNDTSRRAMTSRQAERLIRLLILGGVPQ